VELPTHWHVEERRRSE